MTYFRQIRHIEKQKVQTKVKKYMRTIEITTTQNVTIEYQLAELKDRIFAYLIDWMVISGGMMIIALFFEAALKYNIYSGGGILLNIVAFLLYHFMLEVSMDGQSLGKKAMGLKVVKLNGQEASVSDYLLRTVFHLLDTIFSMGTVGAILISSSNKNQRMGDITANTAVIKVRFDLQFQLDDILKINSIDNYEPTYPEVRQFNEQDMLLIKNIIARYRQYPNKAHEQILDELISTLLKKMDILERPQNRIEFLKTLIKDYIVLTR